MRSRLSLCLPPSLSLARSVCFRWGLLTQQGGCDRGWCAACGKGKAKEEMRARSERVCEDGRVCLTLAASLLPLTKLKLRPLPSALDGRMLDGWTRGGRMLGGRRGMDGWIWMCGGGRREDGRKVDGVAVDGKRGTEGWVDLGFIVVKGNC